MEMKNKIKITCFLLLLCSFVLGQMKFFGFKREILGIKDSWHKIALPNEIFEKVSANLSDLRIFKVKDGKDSTEAPYILKLAKEKYSLKEVAFKVINQSKNDKGYYCTFEIPTAEPINHIHLEFNQLNFDLKLALEGSQDQKEWFTILEGYRILSIKNEHTKYQFTSVILPSSKYLFFRLFIESKIDPQFVAAKIFLEDKIEGTLRNYQIKETKTIDDKKNKKTIITIDLESIVPVCKLHIKVNDTFDYCRPITIQYLSNSVKTLKGWDPIYTTLTSGMLSSFEKNQYNIQSTMTKKLKIIIDNQDNEPLKIGALQVDGYVHELIVRFTGPGAYYLTYGNPNLGSPNFDITQFSDKIPLDLTNLQLGEEEAIEKEAQSKPNPPFFNKLSLWIVMGLIILMLGWFSLKMIKQK